MPSCGGVVLYGFRLAAARIAGDGKLLTVALLTPVILLAALFWLPFCAQ